MTTGPDVAETHLSWVFLSPDRAYKLLKPVELPFLDYTDRSARLAAAERELAMNRRLAPDVYLGLADVREGDELVDRMIVMRRLPEDRRLSALVGRPDFDDCLRAVARKVAAFHADQPPVDPAPMATRDAVLGNWDDNLDVIGEVAGSVIDPGEHERVAAMAHRYLARREPLFERRTREGFVRDGHGDLIADDIFCLHDGPRIIDCLAFADDWRIGDVLLDIAFLVMDVHRLSGASAARAVMDWYREFSNEHHPPSLAHHYVAYRAHVRAKVACLRYQQGDAGSAELARTYHRLAAHHLDRARIRLILVGGGPGVGKSTLAMGLADHYGVPVLRTDEIRKDLTGTPRSEHAFADANEGIYDPATTAGAYGELLREAGALLESAEGVVLDGSWADEAHRAAAREVACRTGAELIEIECRLDRAVARERIARRLANQWDPSDATPDLVDHLNDTRAPWPTAIPVSTASPASQVLQATVELIDDLPIGAGSQA